MSVWRVYIFSVVFLLGGCAGRIVEQEFFCPEYEPQPAPEWVCDDYGFNNRVKQMSCTNTHTGESHMWLFRTEET